MDSGAFLAGDSLLSKMKWELLEFKLDEEMTAPGRAKGEADAHKTRLRARRNMKVVG
jgi:hypothetical protein